jgi:hypothetical protein
MNHLFENQCHSMRKYFGIIFLLLCVSARAQLAVTVSPPKLTGQKAVVQLKIKNDFTNTVQSARAVCFLVDGQGEMVGQSTKWVIGQNKTGLDPKGETTFNFVITSPQPFTTTNLTAKVSFSRAAMVGEKLVDVGQDVAVSRQSRPTFY